VLLGGQVLEDPAPLEDLDDAAAHHVVGRQPVEPLAPQLDGALGDLAPLGPEEPGDCLERGGLAGAVGAQQRGDPRLPHLERHPLEHEDDAVVDHLDVIEREHGDASSEGARRPLRVRSVSGGYCFVAAALMCLATTSGYAAYQSVIFSNLPPFTCQICTRP